MKLNVILRIMNFNGLSDMKNPNDMRKIQSIRIGPDTKKDKYELKLLYIGALKKIQKFLGIYVLPKAANGVSSICQFSALSFVYTPEKYPNCGVIDCGEKTNRKRRGEYSINKRFNEILLNISINSTIASKGKSLVGPIKIIVNNQTARPNKK